MKRTSGNDNQPTRVTRSAGMRNLAGDEAGIVAELDANDESQMNFPHATLVLVNQEEWDSLQPNGDEILSDDEDLISRFVDLPETADIEDVVILEQPAKVPKLDSKGRGRILDSVWNDFHQSEKLPKTKVECNHCGAAVSKKVERLRSHLAKYCKLKSTPVSGRKSVPEISRNQPTMCWPPDNAPVKATISQKSRTQSKLTSGFVDIMTKPEQEQLNIDIGKYIFATNLPFSHVETGAFETFLKKLKPAAVPPTRKVIGNSVLNKVYSEVLKKQKLELTGKAVTIMQDGWKSRTSEPIIAHSITTGEKSYFHNAVSAEENKKTGKYCAAKLEDCIKEVQSYGSEVVAVVTDNCKSMELMRKIISKDNPGIFTYGCHPHLLNLVGKKLTPDIVLNKVQSVHVFFRTHDAAWALLEKNKCARPVLPCETRWNAWVVCLDFYLDNHTKFLEVSRSAFANVPEEICDILNDGKFYAEVKITAEYLHPIQRALDYLQRTNSSLADGVESWITLKRELTIRDGSLQEYFEKQINRALQPVAIASHMLHPNYRGEGLDPSLLALGNEFLSEHNPMYVIIAAQLRRKDDKLFPSHMFADAILKTCSADTWWNTLESLEKISPSTIKFVCKLMVLPAGSADIERHFSVLGNIMNVRRTRLGIEKAARLCVIYKHLAGSAAPGDDGCDWDINDDDL